MGNLFLSSDDFKTEILSAWRYKKVDPDGYGYEYGYILFCQDLERTELELIDGTIDTNGWFPVSTIYETYINTNEALRFRLEIKLATHLPGTYKKAFWKAHEYKYKYSSDKWIDKQEYFDEHNSYGHLDN